MHIRSTLHATSVVFCGRGLLLRGPSGSGKSDLALRIMDAGGMLVSDDYTAISVMDGHLYATPPAAIAGMMEVRGVGLLKVPTIPCAQIDLVVNCESFGAIERLPPVIHAEIEGLSLRALNVYALESSAVAKLRAFLQNPFVP